MIRDNENLKMEILEQKVEKLSHDFGDLKKEVKEVQGELSHWFERMEEVVKNLELARVKLEEQMLMRATLEQLIREEFKEFKVFRSKVVLTFIGGILSLIVYILKGLSGF